MQAKSFLKSGHLPTLISAFLYFDVSFMVWVLLGPLGVQISHDLHLNAGQKGLMVATPVLAGALLRIPNGLFVDHFGPKRVGFVAQLVVITGMLAAWAHGLSDLSQLLTLGIVLGVAGASFAVALPLASRWYPAEYQGTALGIAGAGNSGTVLAALFAPLLAASVGWINVIGLACIPLAIVAIYYFFAAKDAPEHPPQKSLADYLAVLKVPDAWWFMLFYSVTFGGFVGLSSSLTIYFHDQYGLPAIHAGYATAACVFMGSFLRPVGGYVADRIGGIKALMVLYAVAAVALGLVALGFPNFALGLAILMVGMGALGMGNGAVFQLVPQRFAAEIGVMTGIVGCAGGIGGFYLATSLGYAKQFTGSYSLGFLLFAGLACIALVSLTGIKQRWRQTWAPTLATHEG
jgi:NNP family nitrate/nitrite transporter-like MFS transporter